MVSEPTGTTPPARWTPEQAWDLVHAAETTASDLAQIAAQHPHLRPYIAAHPHADPELLTWLGMQNDPVITAALATRATPAHTAPPIPVPAPPAPPAPDPVPVQPTGATAGASTAAQAPVPPPPLPADTTAAAPRARHRTRLIAWVVVAVLVVAGGLTATKLLLAHQAGGAADTPGQEIRLTDMRTKPQPAWTWQPTNPTTSGNVDYITETDSTTLALTWVGSTATLAHLVVLDTATGKTRWQQDVPICVSGRWGPFVVSGDGIIGYYQPFCSQASPADAATTVGLYDATTGHLLTSGTLPQSFAQLVLLDRTIVGVTSSDAGATGQIGAWSVDHLTAGPLWQRPYSTQAGSYECILGPHQVGLYANVGGVNYGPTTCAGSTLGDIADLTKQGANPYQGAIPYPTQAGDVVYESVNGGYLLAVDWSNRNWAVVNPTGQMLRSGPGEPDSTLFPMGAQGGVLLRWDQPTSTIIAVDPATGHDMWTTGIDNSKGTWGASSQALVYPNADGTTLTWYSPTTGRPLAHVQLPSTSGSTCGVVPGQQLSYLIGPCLPNSAQLAAVDLATGQQLWTLAPTANTNIWALNHHLYEVSNSGSSLSVALLTDATH